MNVTIINDCRDANAVGRQLSRTTALLNQPCNFVGVSGDLEAAGNLIDTLDAIGEQAGLVLVNVAPRHGQAKKWPNGTPFGYFWYKKILVVSSIDGLTLSLVKKFQLTRHINVLDIPTAVGDLKNVGLISEEQKNHIINTQFRSFDFLPRIGALLYGQPELVLGTPTDITTFPDAPQAIWWIDNFGNCKTTITREELVNETIQIDSQFLKYYPRLKDVPDKTLAVITGSSGLNEKRFLEIILQGGSAAQTLNLYSGLSLSEKVTEYSGVVVSSHGLSK